MDVPMCAQSQRSRNICTGVMNPYFFPSDHIRVPAKNSVSGMMNAEEDAIRPKVTMPFANACPAEPRMVNAVMFVPNNDSRKTAGPRERPARKYSSAPPAPVRLNAKMPMYRTTAR
jgi:hypothetical protein